MPCWAARQLAPWGGRPATGKGEVVAGTGPVSVMHKGAQGFGSSCGESVGVTRPSSRKIWSVFSESARTNKENENAAEVSGIMVLNGGRERSRTSDLYSVNLILPFVHVFQWKSTNAYLTRI